MTIQERAQLAKTSSILLAAADTDQKNRALRAVAEALREKADTIIAANRQDLELARADNLALPLLKRLDFNRSKIDGAIAGIESLISLPDPVGKTLCATELDQGLELYKVSCPIGVIGVIFESRPDALVQISCLCLKSGNSVLLKGGSEARQTNRVLADIIAAATRESYIPTGWIQILESRADVGEMLALDQLIDLIIPRGSNEFVQYIMKNSCIPVLGHADGICHVYVDEEADVDMAVRVTADSKMQYVAVCNAAETLLVHSRIAAGFLPALASALAEHAVELRGCSRTADIIQVQPATEADWRTEYLDAILAIKIVDSMDEALAHINTYGSGHTDAIITGNAGQARRFLSLVDSGNVFWNCSTRFSDGFRYGLGAEVGISTNKIHARGPVGLDGLLIYKWKLIGQGQTVADYSTKKFTHRTLTRDCPL